MLFKQCQTPKQKLCMLYLHLLEKVDIKKKPHSSSMQKALTQRPKTILWWFLIIVYPTKLEVSRKMQ